MRNALGHQMHPFVHMTSNPPAPYRPQRSIKLTQKLRDPDNLGEHKEYTWNTMATHNHRVQPDILEPTQSSSVPPASVSLPVPTLPATLGVKSAITAPETAESEPPSPAIPISSDVTSDDSSSDNEQKSKKTKKRSKGSAGKAKGNGRHLEDLSTMKGFSKTLMSSHLSIHHRSRKRATRTTSLDLVSARNSVVNVG
ncbi:hypothetical protein QCA50_018090 [Cerrena zonata]|uniref:Uncharacterized protein n=1 Tax=Cerrena zonata TaxID=2478898 RepID=A0AAW0FJ14_9APHY